MFFCEKCFNIYNITEKNTLDQKGGGKLENYVNYLLNTELDNLDNLDNSINETFSDNDLIQLEKLDIYKKLNNKQKDYIYNSINDNIKKNSNSSKKNIKNNVTMQYICKNCGNTETIKPKTLILVRETDQKLKIDTNFNSKEYLEMNYYPRTTQYTCLNDKCKSHNNKEQKSAIFMRINNTYKIRYICETCSTSWII
jgi:hypothetical protein